MERSTSLHDLITDRHPSDAREDRGGRALLVPAQLVSPTMYDPANLIMLASF